MKETNTNTQNEVVANAIDKVEQFKVDDYFWGTVTKQLFDLQKAAREASVKVGVYVENDARLAAIRELGFEVAAFDGYILFYKEPFSRFYGCAFTPREGFDFNGWTKPTDEEIERLKSIIAPKVVYFDNLSDEELALGLSRPL
ncbi:hypothetical protein [Sulfurimonas sp.]|uniref:hypothetical protein n=1 Tax=Sulfurimonas sp. TaxID=2022749 RepID=UPI003D139B65